MSSIASHALAPSFTHTTSVGPAVDFDMGAGDVGPVTGYLTTGTYRMWLAPSASCYLRALQAAINAALIAEGSAVTLAITLSSAGIVTFTFSADVTSLTFAAGMARVLGVSTSNTPVGLRTVTGTRPVWYLALITAATGAYWQPHQPGGAERTHGGEVYAFASAVTSWRRRLAVSYQPTTPAMRSAHSCEATAMYPAEEYMGALGSVATAREWAVLDVLYASRNALCGYTSTWQTARTSTTERTWRVYVAPESLLSTPTELLRPEWLAYTTWELGLSAPSDTPTETRA